MKNTALIAEVLKGMQPSVRPFATGTSLVLDTLPMISDIIVPSFRPVSLHLYTEQEKQQMNQIVSVMIDYNLNYVQERGLDGSYGFNLGNTFFLSYHTIQCNNCFVLDPNIDEVIYFSSALKPKRFLTYSNKQLIAREIEVEKIRRVELHKTGGAPPPTPLSEKQPKIVEKKKDEEFTSSQLPNHLQTLTPITVKKKVGTVSAK